MRSRWKELEKKAKKAAAEEEGMTHDMPRKERIVGVGIRWCCFAFLSSLCEELLLYSGCAF